MRVAGVLVAGGNGSRFGGSEPKQFSSLLGRPVIRFAAEALAPHVSLLQPVGPLEPIATALSGLHALASVPGGATRQESVLAGLEALAPHAPDVVLIHDAARPCVPHTLIPDLLRALAHWEGAIPAIPLSDTLKRATASGLITETVPRSGLFRAQTPQAFRFPTILRLHRASVHRPVTDDAGLLEAAGIPVALVPGAEANIKITYPEDLTRVAQTILPSLVPHVGLGFDVHAFAPARRLVLCGIEIPSERGLSGHSDADVGIHALCDAIYGALAEGDIGRHFPPSDPAWKNADSARFLAHARQRIAARGGLLVNADLTLICERPKIAPYAAAMAARLAELLGVDPDRVAIKATTSERLGFTGRGEGIVAQAIVSLLLSPLPPRSASAVASRGVEPR